MKRIPLSHYGNLLTFHGNCIIIGTKGAKQMAKQERRVFDKHAQVWVHRYKNLCNMAHWHFENELAVCQEGSAEIMLDGSFYTLHKGECAFFCRERVHNIRGTADSCIAVAQFGELLHSPCDLKTPIFADRYGAGARMNELNLEYQKKRPFYAEKMNALITSLLVDIFRGEELQADTRTAQPTLTHYKQLLILLEQRCDEYSFEDAAQFMNLSEAYFSRYFKRMTGLTFSRYMNILRVDRAIELLGQGEDITMADLMARCGFNTLRNFNRVFKEVTGYAPKHLPAGFSLNRRALVGDETGFDPTLDTSIVLTD